MAERGSAKSSKDGLGSEMLRVGGPEPVKSRDAGRESVKSRAAGRRSVKSCEEGRGSGATLSRSNSIEILHSV